MATLRIMKPTIKLADIQITALDSNTITMLNRVLLKIRKVSGKHYLISDPKVLKKVSRAHKRINDPSLTYLYENYKQTLRLCIKAQLAG